MKFFNIFSFIVISFSVITVSGCSSVHGPDRPLTKQERIALYKRLKLPGYTDQKTQVLTPQQIDQLPEKEQAKYLSDMQKLKEERDNLIRHLNKWEKKAVDLYYLSYGGGTHINYNLDKNLHFEEHPAKQKQGGGK